MAATDPRNPKSQPVKRAVYLHRLQAVFRAGGFKTTAALRTANHAKHRGDGHLIEAYQLKEQGFHLEKMPAFNASLSHSARSWLKVALEAE